MKLWLFLDQENYGLDLASLRPDMLHQLGIEKQFWNKTILTTRGYENKLHPYAFENTERIYTSWSKLELQGRAALSGVNIDKIHAVVDVVSAEFLDPYVDMIFVVRFYGRAQSFYGNYTFNKKAKMESFSDWYYVTGEKIRIERWVKNTQ